MNYIIVAEKMSTSPYSIDLREKVINYLKLGNSQNSASILFQLNISTISRWYLRYKREGHYTPRVRIGKRPKFSEAELMFYIESTPDFKACDMGKHFGMTSSGARYWLKKLGFSYKKKTFPMWNQMNKGDKNIKLL